MTTLVLFEDPRAMVFGRAGPDGGQDARSGDGTCVYQAKFHAEGSAARAIADAKREAASIRRYREVEHVRFAQWSGVTRWRLVTNLVLNPTDHQTWIDEVVPIFAEIGLEADYWGRRNLEALLDKHPDVDRSFFGHELRAFLTIPEVRERLPDDEPFLRRSALAPFTGRTEELRIARDFLQSTELFMVVHGPGGVGKSRFLVEFGDSLGSEGVWQVLWANVETLTATSNWFDAIVPERPTVLFVDEPRDEQLLRVLAEQLGGRVGRAARWKVVVAARSPKDPVLRFLSSPRMVARTRQLGLDALAVDVARSMCRALLAGGPLADSPVAWRDNAVAMLVNRFGGYPVWLSMAVHLLEEYRDVTRIPESAAALADSYLDEIVHLDNNADAERVVRLLRWVALLGTVNRENDAALRLLSEGAGIADTAMTLSLLARLTERRGLNQRGANNRLVELRPDVVRDHVLRSWLAVDVGFGEDRLRPSPDATALTSKASDALEKGGLSALGRVILASLARTELLFRLSGNAVPLLDAFFEALQGAIPRLSASRRIGVIEALVEVARIRVRDTIAVVRSLRLLEVQTESTKTILGNRTFSQDDVILQLGWPVYHAAMGALGPEQCVEVLTELVEIAKTEAGIAARTGRGLPNDGKRAGALLAQVIEGGPSFWSGFDGATLEVATRLLASVVERAPTKPEVEALRLLVVPALAIERQQTWAEGNRFVFRRIVINERHPAWQTRASIIEKIKASLANSLVALDSHVVLWGLLADAQRSTTYVLLHGEAGFRQAGLAELLAQLNWTHAVLTSRGVRFEELAAARGLWEWHARHEKDEGVKQAALRLEALYAANDLASDYGPLLEFETMEQFSARATERAVRIAAGGETAIAAFIDRGVRFIGEERKFFALLGVAGELGVLAEDSGGIRQFVFKTLAAPAERFHLQFALAIASRWFLVAHRRRRADDIQGLLQEFLAAASDDETRARLLLELFGFAPPKFKAEELSFGDHQFLRSQGSLFLQAGDSPGFIGLIAWTFRHQWPEYQSIVEQELERLEEPVLTRAVGALIQGVFWATYERDPSLFPATLGTWLLDQLVRVSDLDVFGDLVEWRLGKTMGVIGRVPVVWLARALQNRAQLEAREGYKAVRGIGHDVKLSEFCEPVTEANQDRDEVRSAIDSLLGLVDDHGSVGYRLADILHDVDPHGLVVPRLIGQKIAAGGVIEAKQLARLARAYVVNTVPWRVIALEVVQLAAVHESPEDRRALYRAIGDPSVRSWSGVSGEVPPVFVAAVESANAYRDQESNASLQPFWDWYVNVAEAQLKHQQQLAKEDRENDEEPG